MEETEVKILNIDAKAIEKKIISLGGKKIGSYLVKERFYDFPDKRLGSANSILRIRTLGKTTEFAFKCPVGKIKEGTGFKIREEIQTEVSDVKELERIVTSLGLVLVRDMEKKRTSFVLGRAKLEIDVYPGVPPYLEVESDAKTIPKIVEKLGYAMKDTSNLSSNKILKNYGKKENVLKF
jgi:adenylate cyclase class 2